MTNIGVISDTHGLLRPEAVEALRGVEHILHAGDVGSAEVLTELKKIAPVTVVRGNVDGGAWAEKLPMTEVVEIAEKTIYILHDRNTLDLNPEAAGFDAVIFGHSHQPLIENRGKVLYFNPGSAGPRRFKLPVSVGRIRIEGGKMQAELVPLLA